MGKESGRKGRDSLHNTWCDINAQSGTSTQCRGNIKRTPVSECDGLRESQEAEMPQHRSRQRGEADCRIEFEFEFGPIV